MAEEQKTDMQHVERYGRDGDRPNQPERRSATASYKVYEQAGKFAGIEKAGERHHSSLAVLHAIQEYLDTVFEDKGEVPDLSSEAKVSQAWATLSAIEKLVTTIPEYVRRELPGYFGFPREKKKLSDIESAIAELVERIDVCFWKLEEVRYLVRRRNRTPDRRETESDQNRLVQLVTNRIYAIAPMVTLAPLLAFGAQATQAAGSEVNNELNRDIPTYDLDFSGTESEAGEYAVRTFRPEITEIRSIADHISHLEIALDAMLGLETTVRPTANPPVELVDAFRGSLPASQELQTSPTAELFEIQLTPETSWALIEAISNGQELPADRSQIPSNLIPPEGIAINLPDNITASDIEGFFGHEPNASGFINTMLGQQNWIERFRRGDQASGFISLPAFPNGDGTLTLTSVVNITSPVRDGDIDFPVGSLYYNPTTYLANQGPARESFGLSSVTRVARVTPEVQQQLAGFNVSSDLNNFVLMEVETRTGTPVTVATEGRRLVFINYRAESTQRVNLRETPSLNAEALVQSTVYDLVISSALNYGEFVGVDGNGVPLLPLLDVEAGVMTGVFFDVDGIMKYRDASGGEWVAAKFDQVLNEGTNQESRVTHRGWVSTGVVELVATPTPNNSNPEQPVTIVQATLQPTALPPETVIEEPVSEATPTPPPMAGQPGAATPTPPPLEVADASVALNNELMMANSVPLPLGVERAEIAGNFVGGHYEFDAAGVYRFRWENGAWVDKNPGRSEYENDLPGGSPRLLFERFGDQLAGWDQDTFAYRRVDGAIFIPAMGVEADETRSFDQSDLESGWARQTEVLQSSDFVEGVSGRRIRFYFAENHPNVAGISIAANIESNPNFQAAVDAFLANFDTEERPYIKPGETVNLVVMSDDITGAQEIPIRENRMGSVTLDNIAVGQTVYPDSNQIVIRTSISPSEFVRNNMVYFFLEVRSALVHGLDRLAFGNNRMAISEVRSAEFYESAEGNMISALNDSQITAGYQLWETDLK